MSNILDLHEKNRDLEVSKNPIAPAQQPPKTGAWTRFKEWLKTPKGKKIFIIIIVGFLIFAAAGFVVYDRYFKKDKSGQNTNQNSPGVNFKKEPEVKKATSMLDGIKYPESTANRHPLGIMIENHPEARPQAGLDKAKIVYEAITEGGITRFMAMYGPESAEKVGPVRSARTYYLDWCLEYDCFYSHVGGNLDALQLIPKLGIKDLDQFKYGTQAYWREAEQGKATEHTMFTNTDKLYKIAENNGWSMSSDYTSLEFKTEAPLEQRPELSSVIIDFSGPAYKVKWTYDKASNNYLREMADEPHNDLLTNKQLTAKNVIVQEVQRWNAPTEINEEGWAMKTVGTGNAKIFIDGKVIDGTWKKTNQEARTKYYGTDGKELSFNPGNSWICIVPPDISVTTQ